VQNRVKKRGLYILYAYVLFASGIGLHAAANLSEREEIRHQPIIQYKENVDSWKSVMQAILNPENKIIVEGRSDRTLILVDIDGTIGVKTKVYAGKGRTAVGLLLPIEGASDAIRELQATGAIVLVLTARAYSGEPERAGDFTEGDGTLLDLCSAGFDFGILVSGLGLQNFDTVPGASYHRGVIFAGKKGKYVVQGKQYLAKGLALKEFLSHNPQLNIEKIVLIDNDKSQINSVGAFVQEAKRYDSYLFDFTGAEPVEAAIELFKYLQEEERVNKKIKVLGESLNEAQLREIGAILGTDDRDKQISAWQEVQAINVQVMRQAE